MKRILLAILFFLTACSQVPAPQTQSSNSVTLHIQRASIAEAQTIIGQRLGLPTFSRLDTLALGDEGSVVEFALVDGDNDPCNDLIPDPMVDCWIVTPIDGPSPFMPIFGGPISPDAGTPSAQLKWDPFAIFLDEKDAIASVKLYQNLNDAVGGFLVYKYEAKELTITDPKTKEGRTDVLYVVSRADSRQ